jgi:sugar O-acyltransferase (sialic acid O-acetyltransferase NeuD family)
MQDLLIYGTGGFAREVAWLAESCMVTGVPWRLAGFIDDDHERVGVPLYERPVLSPADAGVRHPGAFVVVAMGNPSTRRRVVQRATDAGFVPITVVHPRVERSRHVQIGQGVVITAGCLLTTDIVLHDHVQINLGCTIGHDVVMHPYASLAPGVHVSGCVEIGAGAYLGTGAVVINGTPHAPLRIGAEAVVGAGAVVTRDVPPGVTVVGVPARPR